MDFVEEDYIPFDDPLDRVVDQNIVDLFNNNKREMICPWIKNANRIEHKGLRLHTELIEFFFFIKPKQSEIEKRKKIINELVDLIKVNFIINNEF